MMAASVPILRTLLRESPESTKQPFVTSPRRALTAESFSAQSQRTVVIESSNRGSGEKHLSFWGMLGDEEKEGGHVREGSEQSWRVNEVAVEYETRKKEDI